MSVIAAAIEQKTIELIGLADVQVPYFDQYFGLWAMEGDRFTALAQGLHGYDVKAHLIAVQQRGEGEIQAASEARSSRGTSFQMTEDGIALINIRGTLMKQQSSMSSATSTVVARRQVRAALQNDDVKAIVFQMESPGGTVAGTQELAADIAAATAKKPTIAYVEDLAASACYWLAAQAGRIVANSMALVGSIGTYGVVYDYSAAAAKEGIKVHVVRAGDFKGFGVPGTELSAKGLEHYQTLVTQMNEHFLAAVASGRKKSIETVRSLADGRMHMADVAKGLGLIDAVETFDDTLAQLRSSLSKSSGRSSKMSTEQPAADTVAPPAAASIDQITAACPGADDSFVLAQLKAKATVAQATSAYMKHLTEANAKLATENKDLLAKQTTTTTTTTATAGKKIGVEPVGTGKAAAGADVDGDPIAAWQDGIAEKVKAGKSRADATRAMVKEQPELHQAYLDATNAKRPAGRR